MTTLINIALPIPTALPAPPRVGGLSGHLFEDMPSVGIRDGQMPILMAHMRG